VVHVFCTLGAYHQKHSEDQLSYLPEVHYTLKVFWKKFAEDEQLLVIFSTM